MLVPVPELNRGMLHQPTIDAKIRGKLVPSLAPGGTLTPSHPERLLPWPCFARQHKAGICTSKSCLRKACRKKTRKREEKPI